LCGILGAEGVEVGEGRGGEEVGEECVEAVEKGTGD
jgi:hypothetical protein